MVSLLRKVKHNRWYDAVGNPGEALPADPLSDLNTKGNSLSVWQVLAGDVNLEVIAAGIAATLDYVTNIDLVLFDEQAIRNIGVNIEPTHGQTPLPDAAGYHRDLVQLRAESLLNIAEVIRRHGDFRGYSEREVRQLLVRYIQGGSLHASDLKDKVRQHLEDRRLI